jgi:hypothetical protein
MLENNPKTNPYFEGKNLFENIFMKGPLIP